MAPRPASAQTGYSQRPVQRPAGYQTQRPTRPVQSQRPASSSGSSLAALTKAPSLLKPALLLIVVLAIGLILQFALMPGGWTMAEKPRANEAVAEIASTKGVRINEVMTANKSACYDETGACPDWIELFNGSDSPIDITGWVLTDKTSRTIRFAFPEHVMQPGDYVMVFASGLLKNDVDGTWHAPFKMSSAGDTLQLFDANGTIVQSMNIPEMTEDCVYAVKEDGTWAVTNEFTPLLENTTLNFAELTSTHVLQDSDIIITEVMGSNLSFRSPSGGLYDWIELYNRGTETVSLTGFGLSDKATKPLRWRFPADVELKPGEYIVVYASGLDRELSGELHTNFSLAAEGETIYLYNASRKIIDSVTYDNLKTDQSCKRQPDDSWAVSTSPTPGSAN